ncbi:MAG: AraC family transcriptional regulator [Paracoccaceae bacterium]
MSITNLELVSEAGEVSHATEAVTCQSIASYCRQSDCSADSLTHHEFNQFIWVSRGGGRACIDGSVRGFGANTAIFVPSLTMHGMSFSPRTQGWVASAGSARDLPLPDQPFVRSVSDLREQKRVVAHFDALNDELAAGDSEHKFALQYEIGLLSVWYRRQENRDAGKAGTRSPARRRLMRKFLQLMEERYRTQDTVNDYATNLAVTPTHLTRICRQTTGKPASTLIQERVLQEARKSLTETDRRVSEIAAQLGYSNPAYFSRQFTERVGKSPTEYRRLMR